MMKTTRNILTVVMTMAAIGLPATSAHAGLININNAGFEDASGAASGGNLATPADWTEEDPGNVYVDNNGLSWSPEADRNLYFNGGTAAVNQDLSHNWSSGDTYTLGMVGQNPGWDTTAPHEFKVQLREADGTVLWESGDLSVTGTVAPGSPPTYTGTGHIFSWDIDASTFTSVSGAIEGLPLNIRIANVSAPTYLDDVSLDLTTAGTPPPPPPTPVAISFGTMTTDGDNGDGAWQTSDGWTGFGTGSGDQANDGSPDTPSFWAGAGYGGTGTSDGDLLAAGDYSIDFLYAPTYQGSQLLVEAFAWDGTTQTLLGSVAPTMPASRIWQNGNLSFSVGSGSSILGDQLQLKFTNTATSYVGWDTITGDFYPAAVAVPEPSTFALAALGLLGLGWYGRRRRGRAA
ncbi:MAG: PEP-CTERM sorting domain-containing protein [Planctomycetes bacterium]|nr:PEP-CTERM sorting domain-containing protein [Planctomycetota bacterium]